MEAEQPVYRGTCVIDFHLLKWFLFCNTSGAPQLSSGKESDEDGLLLERIFVQMYIKMPIFDQRKHLATVVSCRE